MIQELITSKKKFISVKFEFESMLKLIFERFLLKLQFNFWVPHQRPHSIWLEGIRTPPFLLLHPILLTSDLDDVTHHQ